MPSAAADRGDIVENFRRSRRLRRQRQIAQVLQGLHVVLRRLRDHVVADAVLRAQPESRLRLKAAAERDQQALRHVVLRVAALAPP